MPDQRGHAVGYAVERLPRVGVDAWQAGVLPDFNTWLVDATRRLRAAASTAPAELLGALWNRQSPREAPRSAPPFERGPVDWHVDELAPLSGVREQVLEHSLVFERHGELEVDDRLPVVDTSSFRHRTKEK